MNKEEKEAFIWMYLRLKEYASYKKLGDFTFVDDIVKDYEYVKKFYSKLLPILRHMESDLSDTTENTKDE